MSEQHNEYPSQQCVCLVNSSNDIRSEQVLKFKQLDSDEDYTNT